MRGELTAQRPQFAHCGPDEPKIIEQTGDRTLTNRLSTLSWFLKCIFLSITIGLMSGSVPDFWGMLVVHCVRALHKNLGELPCLARERFSASNKVINKISRKSGGYIG